MKKTQIDSLYALKAICAFFVVALHTPCFYKEFLIELFSIAVPCFYMITGYFLYVGNEYAEMRKARKWLSKVIIISLFFNFIYLMAYLITGRLVWDASIVLNLFIFGDSISAHFWYLTALCQALAIFMIFRKYEKLFYFCLLLFLWDPIVYFIVLNNDIAQIPGWVHKNCFARALPYLCAGYLISKNKDRIPGVSYFLIGAIAAFTLMKATEYKFLMLQSVLSVCLFLAALKYDRCVPKFLTWTGKYHSANIYYIHMLVAPFVYLLTPNNLKFMLGKGVAIYAFVLSLIVSMVMNVGIGLSKKYIHM
ncbi:MAG: acyltransferase family protein [Akkermansia sp.]|nr:acyltransferase family protein [Akkermansia sp.]